MKAVFGLIFAVIAAVNCEDCQNVGQCSATTCSGNWELACVEGKCTCVNECDPEPNLARCRNQYDCIRQYNNSQIDCTCSNINDLHCIDGACHCKFPQNPSRFSQRLHL